ncbi:hypothetical protein M1585_02835 [Candidatus Parvarchaeota archaeon]|jgi:hypothetical protein|nr:hypothetical protein [Candidatus Parvarchaeota archaeon]
MFTGRTYYLDSLPEEIENQSIGEDSLSIKKKNSEGNDFTIYYVELNKREYFYAYLKPEDSEPQKVFIVNRINFNLIVSNQKDKKLGITAFAYPKLSDWNRGMYFLLDNGIFKSLIEPQININDIESIKRSFAPRAIIKVEFQSIPSEVDHREHESTGRRDISTDAMVSNDIKSGATINMLIIQCKLGKSEGKLVFRADGRVSYVGESEKIENDEIAHILLDKLINLNMVYRPSANQQKTLDDIFKS